ncbi:MAG: HAD-IIIA family hydrolase [Puniceicoccales bacterium]|jgi:D-glycero-D-manno-heptose 1,7-bisphosphate phosphatase|nr:HAD-IIIA family hydrolase [Puniceicoccales bacterium]
MTQSHPKKAVFLDRDGTLIEAVHYLHNPDLVVPRPGSAQALRELSEDGWMLFLFTNQAGVGHGIFTPQDVHRVNARMFALLGLPPGIITETCIPTETGFQPGGYRKPSPRFILEMSEKWRLDKTQTWMVGDSPVDWGAAFNAGVRAAAISSTAPAQGMASFENAFGGGSVIAYPDLLAFARGIMRAPRAE